VKQPDTDQADSWAFFDKIYCISLKERTDRRVLATKQFAAVGLLERVEFIIVEKHPVNREKGIFQSHLACLKRGLSANAKHILIFEDDVFFQGFDAQALRKVCTCLKSDSKWNALFLGCITDGSSRTDIQNLVKIKYRCLAHAYALNQPFAKYIARQPWTGLPFDELLRRRNSDFYALHPMCAFQGLAGSDNQTVMIDRMRRLFGGLPFIQKVNEMYQNNKPVLLLAPLLVLLGLVLLTIRFW
jgi:GR25 family glycosyltransferase involved in LPS biosynthesis